LSFQPQVNQELPLDGVPYRIAEHPAAPGMPYGQEGRQAIVYQLVTADQEKRALKVFKAHYRLPALVSLADKLAPFAEFPGLQVCQRTVLSARRHGELVRQYPDLTYAVLMPWVEGPTWMEVLVGGQDLAPGQSLALARDLTRILAGMEECGLAHCDLSASNLLLPLLAGGQGVQLVDVEQLHGPGLEQPRMLPGGSPGYAHRTAPDGLWGAEADRFAGAVLLAELLGWCDARVRQVAWGENYFAPEEMQQDTDRARTLVSTLRERWGDDVALLFERAWRSETLQDCPTFGEWLAVLPERVAGAVVEVVEAGMENGQTESPDPGSQVLDDDDGAPGVETTALERTAQSLYQALEDQIAQGSWEEADRLGQALEVLWPGYRDAELLLEQARQGQQEEQNVREEIERWEEATQGEEARLAEGQGALEEERRVLGEKLRAVEAREGELRQQVERLAGTRRHLTEARQLLAAHRWNDARKRLAGLGMAASEASSESSITRPEVPSEPKDEPPSRQVRDRRWVDGMREVRYLQHPQRASGIGRWLAGDTTCVMSVAFSPAGSVLASGSTDMKVSLWQVESGELLRTCVGHTDAVWDVDFSPDGEILASGSKDGTVRLWKVADGTSLCILKAHEGGVHGVAFSPDGGTLASGAYEAYDGTVCLWRVPDGTRLRSLEGHSDKVSSVAFSPDGKILASGAHDAKVCLWRVADGSLWRKLEGHKGPALCVAFSPDGRILASGTRSGTVHLWDAASGSVLRTLEWHTAPVRGLAFSPDGDVLASGSEDGKVYLWAVSEGMLLRALREPTGEARSLAFSPDGTLLAVGAWAGTVRLWGTVR